MFIHTKDRYYSAGALRPWWPSGTGAYDSELCSASFLEEFFSETRKELPPLWQVQG